MTDLELQRRLHAAEMVCVLFGWSPVHTGTDRDKAVAAAWSAWADLVGSDFTGPKAHPELTDDVIANLARHYDETRQQTLRRFGVSEDAR